MQRNRRLSTVALAAVLGLGGPTVAASSASATIHDPAPLGTTSLSSLLARDASGFDSNGKDFDVLQAAVSAVLASKPGSGVKVLAQGTTPLTAFLPTDDAFRRLAASLTGTAPSSEQKVFQAVASLGIDTVERVLLYHVVPGKRLFGEQLEHAWGCVYTTALGTTIKVDPRLDWFHLDVYLVDKDFNAPNAMVTRFDVNKGNRQIAQVVDQVLRPVDLPPLGYPDGHPHH